jgi:hypothetical protein
MSKYIDQIQNYTDRIYKKSGGNSNNSNNNRNRRNNNDNFDEDEFVIRNNNDSVVIGDSDNGKIAFLREKLEFGETRCLITGMSGSGKSFTTRNIIEQLCENKTGMVIILDPEGEYYTLRTKFNFVILGTDETFCDIVINEENAEDLALKMMINEINVIIDLKKADDRIRQEIATKFIDTIVDNSDISNPMQLIIEEASIFAKKGTGATSIQNIKCTESLKKTAKLGRKRSMCTFYCVQRITQLHPDITAECNTFIIGKSTRPADCERSAELIGLKGRNSPNFAKLNHEFFSYGEGFDYHEQADKPIKFKSKIPSSKHNRVARRDSNLFPKPETETVKKWISLMKSIKDIMKDSINNKAAITDKPVLALVPPITIDSSSFIPIAPPKPVKNWEDEADEKMFGNLSDSCEVCGKTAIAHNRCEKHADYDPRLKDFDDDGDNDDDDDDNDNDESDDD